MIFTPPHYLSRVKGYSQLLLCEAPKLRVCFTHGLLIPHRHLHRTRLLFQVVKFRPTGVSVVVGIGDLPVEDFRPTPPIFFWVVSGESVQEHQETEFIASVISVIDAAIWLGCDWRSGGVVSCSCCRKSPFSGGFGVAVLSSRRRWSQAWRDSRLLWNCFVAVTVVSARHADVSSRRQVDVAVVIVRQFINWYQWRTYYFASYPTNNRGIGNHQIDRWPANWKCRSIQFAKFT